MLRYHVIFKGRVQGVGFRYQAKMLADKNNITGSVKNLTNGHVEAYVQADEKTIEKFIKEIKNLRFVRIESIDYKKIPIKAYEKDFKILY